MCAGQYASPLLPKHGCETSPREGGCSHFTISEELLRFHSGAEELWATWRQAQEEQLSLHMC